MQRKSVFMRNVGRSAAALAALAGVGTGVWAFEETSSAVGLKGIFSEQVPAGLDRTNFDLLDGNWAPWSAETADLVEKFYKFEGDLPAQRAALAGLKGRLSVIEKSLADPKYRSLYKPLISLRGALAARIDLAAAALDTLDLESEATRKQLVVAAADKSAAAVAALTADLSSVSGGAAWLPYIGYSALADAWKSAPEASPEALAAADATRAKIDGAAELADAGQKAFLSRPSFKNLSAALAGYTAAVNKWKTPANPAELRTVLQQLVSAAEGQLASPNAKDAAAVRGAYKAIADVAADGGAKVAAALQSHFFNYNLRILVDEQFLSRVMGDSRTENGPVVDFVLGANVSGNQTTTTSVAVNLKPSPNTLRFDLNLNGNVRSSTVSTTSEATVYSQGNHNFLATKEVNFDGERFTTRPATIQVNPSSVTTGVATQYSGGLFGGIADNIANNEVAARKPQADAIAASRIQDKVLPRFNSEVDSAMQKASTQLEQDLFGGLKDVGLYPDAKLYTTSETNLRISTRLMAALELGGNTPSAVMTSLPGATLLMHESVINNSLDRLNLAGRTLTDEELRLELQKFLEKAFRRPIVIQPQPKPAPVAGEEDEKGPAAFIFAKEDPIRVKAVGGELMLLLRAGFQQPDKDPIPTVEIAVPIRFTVDGANIVVDGPGAPTQIRVSDVDGSTSIAVKGVIRKKLLKDLPTRTVSGTVKLKGTQKEISVLVRDIQVNDGWIAVNVN